MYNSEYYIWRIKAWLIEFPDCLDGGANRLLAELVDPVAYVRVDLSRAALQRSTGPSAGLDQREGGESDLFSAVGQPGSSLPSPQRPEGTASP